MKMIQHFLVTRNHHFKVQIDLESVNSNDINICLLDDNNNNKSDHWLIYKAEYIMQHAQKIFFFISWFLCFISSINYTVIFTKTS